MAVPGRTTQLEAVNTMLSAIGETPTTADIITANSSADVVMAVQILDEVTKEVESQGWNFNTEYDVELVPDAVGKGAQGMVHIAGIGSDVYNNDRIEIGDTSGVVWMFYFTTDASLTTGDGAGTNAIYVSMRDGLVSEGEHTRNLFTTQSQVAKELAIAINHANASALNVTAVQVKADGSWVHGAGEITLEEYPTNHPYYLEDSDLVRQAEHVLHIENVLLTQDVVGTGGNQESMYVDYSRISENDWHPVDGDDLSTYNFGENGMRVGSDIGHITLGTDVARVDLESHNQGSLDPIMKYSGNEWKLYDKKDKTYEFTKTLKATVIYYLDFIGLPQPAQRHITIRAARIFQDRMVGSQSHHAFNMQDEYRSLADLKEWEGDSADHTIFDNYDIYRTVNRGNSVR